GGVAEEGLQGPAVRLQVEPVAVDQRAVHVEEDGAHPGGCGHVGHRSRRYSWMYWMAVEPSPTAAPIRFTEPARASPATKTPGRAVSSGKGSRSSGQPGGPPRARAGPASTYPCGSRATTPSSHSVAGLAPMKTKSAPVGTVSCSPLSRSSMVMVSRRSSPEAPTTVLLGRKRTLSMLSSRSSRYSD